MAEFINRNYVKATQAIDTATVVNQAAGMLSVQLDVQLPEALVWMRSYAFVHGQFLAEFAADVVDRRLSFGVDGRES